MKPFMYMTLKKSVIYFNYHLINRLKIFQQRKAKLKVLVALSHQAKLLILDEPTAGLDVIARDELFRYVKKLYGTK